MSMNRAINATIALIEGRTDIAKEVFRDATSDVKDVPPVLARLEAVVNKAAAKAIRNGLVRALALQPASIPKRDTNARAENEKCFFDGVSAVELLFNQIANELEQR